MNILFLTIIKVDDIHERGIYTDLLRKFKAMGHNVYVVCTVERRYKKKTTFLNSDGVHILQVWSPNIQKANIVEKGIGTLMLERSYLKGIKKYLDHINFDMVLYSTPPITFSSVITYVKKKCNALSYLMLKDIFPQNAVDLGMMRRNGFLHNYFRRKEKNLYRISDYIGCMSPANVAYIRKHEPHIPRQRVEIFPNSIELSVITCSDEEKNKVRNKYGIPKNVTVCIYGGNLGRPQGLDFLLEVIKKNRENDKVFFLVVGGGTEFGKIDSSFKKNNLKNALLFAQLPKSDYDKLVQSCDIGMIFLSPDFTIPNFPSRILSYMEYSMPVLLATDRQTDIGTIAMQEGFGLACLSGDMETFNKNLGMLVENEERRKEMGNKGRRFLEKNYQVENTYQIIMAHLHATI